MADAGLISALVAAALAAAPPATSPEPTPTSPAHVAEPAPAEPAARGPVAPTAVPSPDLSPGTSPTPEGPAPAPAAPVKGRYTCHGSVPCKRLVALSAVTGALGLAGIATGVALAVRPTQVDANDPTTAITYRPVGVAVLTIGVGVLTTSILMILTANRASRRALQKRTRPLSLAAP